MDPLARGVELAKVALPGSKGKRGVNRVLHILLYRLLVVGGVVQRLLPERVLRVDPSAAVVRVVTCVAPEDFGFQRVRVGAQRSAHSPTVVELLPLARSARAARQLCKVCRRVVLRVAVETRGAHKGTTEAAQCRGAARTLVQRRARVEQAENPEDGGNAQKPGGLTLRLVGKGLSVFGLLHW